MVRPTTPARLTLLVLHACLASACAHAPAVATDAPYSLPANGPVDVRWREPSQFEEMRYGQASFEDRRGEWVEELAQHLRERAASRLAPGDHLLVEFIDIDRAGDFERWRAVGVQDTRVVRDIYPPRMRLNFVHTDANGTVLAQGERRLTDAGFLSGARGIDSDRLRFEKRLLDQWLVREFPR
ncbi:DUF3016 domain-containing protein [Agrilutibacter solisilvae]|uniref:DUF3016 domain-containing protein n=1 Tax=Agrilutibacter solisilvae TaxID=2763317 RepID=A0A974XZX6_9GAMM|nr:DUF3016 domain-containing protein [Lysobacter solisilvae]QSX78852.1 DUF3016 domain-containing protein [Lysobacter solisilvae]